MSKTKKALSLAMASVMVLMAACSPSGKPGASGDAKKYEYTDKLTIAGTNALATLDYVVTAKSADHAWNANFIDGLVETDNLGNYKPALAESWSHNKDNTKYTFKLRKGVKWATYDGQEYDEVTAKDFVTGLRHAAEFGSEINWLGQGTIKGFSEYLNSDFSNKAWEKVGVKALDKYTVEYTLEKPTPYFLDFGLYNILMPINQKFLESKGAGCKLGSPNPEKCSFGAVKPDSILYNGPYVLSQFDQKSAIKIVANDLYWDTKNVFVKEITEVYDDGKDPYSIKTGYEQGTYPSMALRPTWEDYQKIRDQYKDYVRETPEQPNTFGILFNFNRQVFKHTNYAKDKASRENTQKAVRNLNFRKAVRAAFDKKVYLQVIAPEQLAESTIRNVFNFPDAGTLSDGTRYFDLVQKAYQEKTGEKVELKDGKDAFLSKEKALDYIKKAEAEGVKFPVHLDLLVVETSDTSVKQANSLKKSIADNTDNKIIIEPVLRPQDVVYGIAYRNEDPAAADYDIGTFTGWGPDFQDPKSFVDTLSPVTGAFMRNMGLRLVDKSGNVLDKELKEQLGFMKFEQEYRKADAETKNLDTRYKLFANADASVLENVLYIPTQMGARGEVVSKYEPFTVSYSQVGIRSGSYKYLKVRAKDPLRADEYKELKQKWEDARKKAASEAKH